MLVNSEMIMGIGEKAPDFSLLNYQNNDFKGKKFNLYENYSSVATVVMFICNHCPYVIHIKSNLCELALTYQQKGITFIAINSNDIVSHPQDGPDYMLEQNLPFTYLFDHTQEVAKSYKAACTPDFFVFNENLKCFYRGRYDASRPGNDIKVTGNDLALALDSLIANKQAYPGQQHPSIGCNIKWRKS
ncbi:MAG: thioredoxin family protein [Pseudomonadota bacterium]|nr:thioredoxin family protein [Pseudomonadota bacterium]